MKKFLCWIGIHKYIKEKQMASWICQHWMCKWCGLMWYRDLSPPEVVEYMIYWNKRRARKS